VTAISLNCWSESDQKAIREQLVRVLNSGPYHQSQRRSGSGTSSVDSGGRGEAEPTTSLAVSIIGRSAVTDPRAHGPTA
jgi:hypothetical protein